MGTCQNYLQSMFQSKTKTNNANPRLPVVLGLLYLSGVGGSTWVFQKCQEQNVDLYITLVNITKEFDTFSHGGLWRIMAKFGSPSRFIAMAW